MNLSSNFVDEAHLIITSIGTNLCHFLYSLFSQLYAASGVVERSTLNLEVKVYLNFTII